MNLKFKSFFVFLILGVALNSSFGLLAMEQADEEIDSDKAEKAQDYVKNYLKNLPKKQKNRAFGNDDDDYEDSGLYNLFNGRRPSGIKANMGYKDVVKKGVKTGIYEGLERTTRDVVSNSLRFIPTGMTRLSGFMAAMLYKLSFGSRGLYVSDLAKINNRIYGLCLPFTAVSAGSMDKRRRANLIGEDSEGIVLDDNNWQVVQKELVNEIEHAIYYLEKSIPCYDLSKLKCSAVNPKLLLAKVVHALSNEDHEEISFYILRAIVYLNKLVERINGFTSFEDTQSKCEETKRWLSWALNSFEQVALFLDDTASMKSNTRIQFQRINMQAGSSGGSSLDSLLGSLQGN